MNSLFGEFFRIFLPDFGPDFDQIWGQIWGQIFGQVLGQVFWGQKIQCTFLLGQRKYSVQFYRDREIQYYTTIFYLLFSFQKIPKSALGTIQYNLSSSK